jgi:hypothetical protein
LLPVRYVYCRQQMFESCFLILHTSLCLLIRELEPLIFSYYWKVCSNCCYFVHFIVFDSSLLLICLPAHLVTFSISYIFMVAFIFLLCV